MHPRHVPLLVLLLGCLLYGAVVSALDLVSTHGEAALSATPAKEAPATESVAPSVRTPVIEATSTRFTP